MGPVVLPKKLRNNQNEVVKEEQRMNIIRLFIHKHPTTHTLLILHSFHLPFLNGQLQNLHGH